MPYLFLLDCFYLFRAPELRRPPFDSCVRAISPNYAPAWCAKKDNAAYGAFVKAYQEYQKAIDEEAVSNMGVLRDLSLRCTPENPPTDVELTMILSPLTSVSRKANDRAAVALNTMKAQAAAAFKDNPDAASISSALDGFRDVIERFGRNTMLIESAADVMLTACKATETAPLAADALGAQVRAGIEADNAYLMGTVLVDKILEDTAGACAAVRIVPPITPSQMRKKTGFGTQSITGGGATMTLPKKLDVGKKSVRLPVTVTNPAPGYGSVTVKRGPKGIVASGGQMTGSFGMWLTVPKGTKTGNAVVTFTSAGGVLKGTVRFV